VEESNDLLRETLDSRDTDMVTAVDNAWNEDKAIVTNLASKLSAMMKKAEDTGVQLINSEMQSMFKQATKAITTNTRLIDTLARQKIRAANASAKAVMTLANRLWTGTNSTIAKADAQYRSMNSTQATLSQAQVNLTRAFQEVETAVAQAAAQKFNSAQNDTGHAQLTANSNVDQTLQQMAQDVNDALDALTREERRNMSSMTTSVGKIITALSATIASYSKDAKTRSTKLGADYNAQLKSAGTATTSLFNQVNQNMASVNTALLGANSSATDLQTYMKTQFANLDSQVSSMFQGKVQDAQKAKNDLTSYMDNSINTFKGYALNASQDASTDLQNAFNSAMSAVTSGSNALSMTYEQRKQVIAALKNWQQSYKGNTDKLVSAFQETYNTLIINTNSQLNGAIKDAMQRIANAQDDQQALIDQAMQSAKGDPAALQQILSRFGIVGNKAVAAVALLQQQIASSGGAMQNGVRDGLDALDDLKDAADANSEIYQLAAAKNSAASAAAGAAVQNVTARLSLMNSYMNQYANQISTALFNAQTAANDAIGSASAGQDNTTQAAIQAKMAQVQSLLADAIAQGHTSAAEIAAFAAQIGANATVLTQLVDSLENNSSEGLSDIAQVKADAIDGLKSQVDAQMASMNSNFDSQLDGEKASLGALIESMKNDLMTQSGAESQQLVAKRDYLQNLFGQLTASGIARDRATKDLQDQFNDAETKVSQALPDLKAKITAQQNRVQTAYADQMRQLNNASATVNSTISNTNKTANDDLARLAAQGDAKVESVRRALSESSGAVAMMIDRYQTVMQKFLNEDNQARVKQNADELSKLIGVQSQFNSSSVDQKLAYLKRVNSSDDRAKQLASIMADLSGAQSAASQGQAAFRAYVKNLAAQSGVSMQQLVASMQSSIDGQTNGLAKLLSDNGLFVTDTLNKLKADASAVQKGVVDGSGDVLNNVRTSLSATNSLSSQQNGQLTNLSTQGANMTKITGDQLAQLMSILLAQQTMQSDANMAQYQGALSRTADVRTAMNMYSDAMAEATQADVDALDEAAQVTDTIDTEAQAAVDAAAQTALAQGKNYTDIATVDYKAIQDALDAAAPVVDGFETRIKNAEASFDEQRPHIESEIKDIQGDIDTLKQSVASGQQGQVDRVSKWVASMQQSTIAQLKEFQKMLATTTTTTPTPAR